MGDRDRVAVSAGGSIVAPDELDPGFITSLGAVLLEASRERDLLVVVGGGRLARRYISACRDIGADEAYLDLVGIDATRLNARLLVSALGRQAYHSVPSTLHEALDAARDFPIVVMGGTHPGHTTDAVCAMLAELAHAGEMLNLTNVDGVYTADPRADPGATLVPRMTTEELLALVGAVPSAAGTSTVIDPMAARIIHRAKITTKVLDGRDLAQVAAALAGERFHGTTVVPSGEG